jgi:hypothetical protein
MDTKSGMIDWASGTVRPARLKFPILVMLPMPTCPSSRQTPFVPGLHWTPDSRVVRSWAAFFLGQCPCCVLFLHSGLHCTSPSYPLQVHFLTTSPSVHQQPPPQRTQGSTLAARMQPPPTCNKNHFILSLLIDAYSLQRPRKGCLSRRCRPHPSRDSSQMHRCTNCTLSSSTLLSHFLVSHFLRS